LAVGQNNGNNAWGGEWIWVIVLFALFGWGGNGWGNQNRGQVGGQEVGYELGKLATTNDVASGFANSASLASLNDLKLGQAGIQQTLCQGFSGVNTTILQGNNATQREIANIGFQLQNCTLCLAAAILKL
jgi:hypothetical protein